MYIHVYIYIHIYVCRVSFWAVNAGHVAGVGLWTRHAAGPRQDRHWLNGYLRPIPILTLWVSEGLTQAQS